jgi:hypothetical protein
MYTEIQIKAWKCSECGNVWTNEYVASTCCKQYTCDICGVPTPKSWTRCDACREKKCYDAATKITLKEWEEKYPSHMVYYNDRYFYSVEELFEHYAGNNDELPTYCYGTDINEHKIDVDSVLENIEEDMCCEDDDYRFSDQARKELADFAEQWNEKWGLRTYECNKTVILIPEEVLNEYRK